LGVAGAAPPGSTGLGPELQLPRWMWLWTTTGGHSHTRHGTPRRP